MVQFPIYEELKAIMCSGEHTLKKNTFCYLAASAISASLACILTYPAEVVRARLQAQHYNVRKYNGIVHAFRKIWMQEGTLGLYRGLFTSLIKMTPAHAISFTAYEFFLRTITSYYDWNTFSDFNTSNLPKNESAPNSFRPFFPPNFERFPRLLSRAPPPQANPYTFSPSFTHLIANQFTPEPLGERFESTSSPSPAEEGQLPPRWCECFW